VIDLKIYILAGMPGAGKEEFVKVSREMGYDVIRMGDVVRGEAERRGVASDDASIGGLAHSERQLYGYDIWARRTVPLVGDGLTIIDGCRGTAELEVFRRHFGEDVRIIAIHASPRTRFNRLKKRQRDDAPTDWNQFQERDRRELGWGLGKVIAQADYMIVNEGTLEDFRRKAREVLESLER